MTIPHFLFLAPKHTPLFFLLFLPHNFDSSFITFLVLYPPPNYSLSDFVLQSPSSLTSSYSLFFFSLHTRVLATKSIPPYSRCLLSTTLTTTTSNNNTLTPICPPKIITTVAVGLLKWPSRMPSVSSVV